MTMVIFKALEDSLYLKPIQVVFDSSNHQDLFVAFEANLEE